MRLLVLGPDGQRLRQTLPPERPLWIGRAPRAQGEGAGASRSGGFGRPEPLAVPWDRLISRCHAEVIEEEAGVTVRRLSSGRNPIFYRGREEDRFSPQPGEAFVIGDTTFRLLSERLAVAPDQATPVEVVGYSASDIDRTRYDNADQRLEVLSTLPRAIRQAEDEGTLLSALGVLLLEGVPAADSTAVVRVDQESEQVEVLTWDSRDDTATSFTPSRRLILEAVRERQQSVRSIWLSGGSKVAEYTVADDLDWAFCTPVPGESCAGWGLYAAGRFRTGGPADDEQGGRDLKPDIKFAELVAEALGALRDMQRLQQRETMLGRFFSPKALPLLTGGAGGRQQIEEALAPRQTEVTVLFCDLRGFSRRAEASQGDLLGLLERVSHALDVMTGAIHGHGGVVGDFQGDAALAFWGWPIDDPAAAEAACRAALAIRRSFRRASVEEGHLLEGFRCGIGVASGEAVAGRLGSSLGRFKIDVFGPVVNLAARLEGITKQLGVPVLVDETTARQLAGAREGGEEDAGWGRLRRMARLRPYGMRRAVTVYEALPPLGEEDEELTVELVVRYEEAVAAFEAGRWEEAMALLHDLPHWDHGKDFLTAYILRHQRRSPTGWDGVVQLDSK